MPLKQRGIHTGVSSSVRREAESNKMSSQPDLNLDLDLAALEAEIQAEQEEAMPDSPQPAAESVMEEAAQDSDTTTEDAILKEIEATIAGQLTAPSPQLQKPAAAAEAPAAEALATEAQPTEPAEEAAPETETAPTSVKKLPFAKPAFAKPGMPKKVTPAATEPFSSEAAAASTSPAKPAVPKKNKLLVAKPSAAAENEEPAAKKPAAEEPAAKSAEDSKPAEGAKLPAARPKTKATLKALAKKPDDSSAEGSGEGSAPAPTQKAVAKTKAKLKPAEDSDKAPAKPKGTNKGTAAKAGGSGEAAPKDKGPKRAKSAYLFFAEAQREEVKAENPGVSFGKLGKLLGAKWGELPEDEKAPYKALAAADKERYESEKTAAGPSAPKAPKAPKEPKQPKTSKKGPKVKSAWELFCDERRPDIEKDNPKAGPAEITKLLSITFKELPEEDRAVLMAQHQELKAAAAGGSNVTGEDGEGGDKAAGGKKRGRPAGGKGGKKRAKKDASSESQGMEDETMEEEDEEEKVYDWVANPAERILSITSDGKYVVLRRGMGFNEPGLFDAAVAKQQRLGKTTGEEPCPVPLELVEEFEASERSFHRAVHDSMIAGYLELEDIPEGSPLEACSFLGLLREPCGVLSKVPKGDIKMAVPVLATSKIVQRMLDAERARAEAWRQRAESAEALLAAGTAGKGAEESPNTHKKKGVEV